MKSVSVNRTEIAGAPAMCAHCSNTMSATPYLLIGGAWRFHAFRTRTLATDLLEVLPQMEEGRSRPARLFRVRHHKPVFFARTFSPRS